MSRQIDVKALVSHIVRGDGADKCRICMGDTSGGHVYLTDTVMLDGDRPVTLIELLETITGIEMEQSPVLPNTLCSSCKTNTLNAYSFLLLTRESNQVWLTFTNLSDKLLSIQQMNNMYILINNTGNASLIEKKNAAEDSEVMPLENSLSSNTESPKRSFRCPDCNKEFNKRNRLKIHMRWTNKRFCDYCSQSVEKQNFQKHLLIHNKISYTCKICMETYEIKSKLKKHIKDKHLHRKYECIDCKTSFNCTKSYHAHLPTHKTRVCPKCLKRFKNSHCYLYHVKLCLNQKIEKPNFICDFCNKAFKEKTNIRRHIEVVHMCKRYFTCEECDKTFSNRHHLIEHQYKHKGVPNLFICHICTSTFASRRGYERHAQKHKNKSIMTKKVVKRQSDIKNVHDEIKVKNAEKYECNECDKMFSYKKNLMSHLNYIHKALHNKISM